MGLTTSELMKAMSEAGAPFEAILIAVQALDAKDAEIAQRDREQAEKRAKDAERKRADRASGVPYRRRPRTIRGQSNDETRREVKTKKPALAKPVDVSPQVWNDWIAQRKTKPTETALAGIRREADLAGWSLNAALAEGVERGWQGFKAAWVEKKPGQGGGEVLSFAGQLLARQAARSP